MAVLVVGATGKTGRSFVGHQRCQNWLTILASIIAEFVQNEETMEFLADCQIQYAQGYYLGEPEPIPD